MNISYKWLKQYIDTALPAEEIGKILTSIGLEVGTIEEKESIKGGLKGLVVGEVLTCENHPNSDHLHVTSVNVGEGEPLQIVCGAANCRAGLKTIVATLGTVLYDGDKEFVIKKSKLRGVESYGMLCAEDEIGVGNSHEGIIELPADVAVGTKAADYYKVESDAIIEVDITPNRIDAASHYGVARDLYAYLSQHDKNITLTRPSIEDFKIDSREANIGVRVEDTEACPRYTGVAVWDVEVKESPEWLQNALRSIGLRPINNVVDITNYILHSFALPMHAFDYDQIEGEEIVVKKAEAGTKFVTLDGVERTLDAADLMICNTKEPMCIAGVFGGIKSGVTERTKRVFLEAAYFNPVSIRKTARRHGLNTDASFRYERGCDPNINLYVLKLAALMVKELAGGRIVSEVFDTNPHPIEDKTVNLRYKKVNDLIGKALTRDEVKSIVGALEMKTTAETEEGLTLQIPAYRVDVERDVDVIEDILRIYGYNNVIPDESLKGSLSYPPKPDGNRLEDVIAEQLTAQGFNEILNNSLTKTSYYEGGKTYNLDGAVKILNPLSSDLGVMRQTLFFGGMESLSYNVNRRASDLKFYEFGNCYHYTDANRREGEPLAPYAEEPHFGLWLTGNRTAETWVRKAEEVTYYDLKGYVENILRRLGFDLKALKTEAYADDILSEGVSIMTASKRVLGVMGVVSEKWQKAFDLRSTVYYADLAWNEILKACKKHKVKFVEIPKYPEVRRDLSLLLDKETTFGEIEQIAYDCEKKLLKGVSLFDVYQGKNLPNGKKSYAVNFTLQDEERTMGEKQIDAIMQKIRKALEDRLGAELR